MSNIFTHFFNTNNGDYMYSDLMIEAVDIKSNGIINEVIRRKNIKITKICNKNDKYITIEFKDMYDKSLKNYIVKSIDEMLNDSDINSKSSILIVGLGNEKSTPDSLGPLVIDNIIVTRHLEVLNLNSNRVVSALKPGVMGQTGIETKDIIKGVISKIKPDYLIIIDSLKSNSLKRLMHTIQFTNTGIHPGSGVQNKREEISEKTMGIPVIAIGIPTVCDIKTIVKEDNDKSTNNCMIVTPKDIDFVIEKLSDILSIAINNALYNL